MVGYEHTQRSPLWILMGAIGAVFLVAAAVARDARPELLIIAATLAAATLIIALLIGRLTVRDEGERLAVIFGPISVFRAHFDYAEMSAPATDRSALIDGWGIHWVPFRGWMYNVWGRGCVRVQVGKRTVRIGTDDVAGLLAFLEGRLGNDRPSS